MPTSQLRSSYLFYEHLPTLWADVHTRYTTCQGLICQARALDAGKPSMSGFLLRVCITASCSNRKRTTGSIREEAHPTAGSAPTDEYLLIACSRGVVHIGNMAVNAPLIKTAGATPSGRRKFEK
jgi:hypothetical protein